MDLGKFYTSSKELGKIDFSKLVHDSSTFKIIPVDMNDADHKTAITLLGKALNNFVNFSRKATRFTGNRVNDIGSALEETIQQEISKVGLKAEKSKGSGYPDLIIKYGNLMIYVEMKSSGTKKKYEVNHRLFYYTSGKKIKTDALHLLLQIELTEVKDKIWIVDSWVLRDLAKLKVGLKSEFNANQKDFDMLGSISSSS